MNAIRGRVANGSVVFESSVEWPDGTEVVLREAAAPADGEGMREEDWPTTPEGIEALLKRWDELEPLEFTPEEEADLAAWRQRSKEDSIARADERIRGLFP